MNNTTKPAEVTVTDGLEVHFIVHGGLSNLQPRLKSHWKVGEDRSEFLNILDIFQGSTMGGIKTVKLDLGGSFEIGLGHVTEDDCEGLVEKIGDITGGPIANWRPA
jgi:hypothetical protein